MRELRYSPDQPRDSHGRFGEGSSATKFESGSAPAFSQEKLKSALKDVQEQQKGEKANSVKLEALTHMESALFSATETKDVSGRQAFAFSEDKIAAAGEMMFHPATVAIITSVGSIIPGGGSTVMKSLIEQAKAYGAKRIELATSTDAATKGFYEKFGFKEVSSAEHGGHDRVLKLRCVLFLTRELRYSPDQPRDDHGRFGEGDSTGTITEAGWIKSDGSFHPNKSNESHSASAERLGLSKNKGDVYGKVFAKGAIRVAVGIHPDHGEKPMQIEIGPGSKENQATKDLVLQALDRFATNKVEIDYWRTPEGGSRPSRQHFEGTIAQAKNWVETGKEPSRLSKFRSLRYSPDQPRDDHGRFGEGSSSTAIKASDLDSKERAAMADRVYAKLEALDDAGVNGANAHYSALYNMYEGLENERLVSGFTSIVTHEGEIVAVANATTSNDGKTATIEHVGSIQHGAGGAAVEHLVGQIKAAGQIEKISLIASSNAVSKSFYENLGFKAAGDSKYEMDVRYELTVLELRYSPDQPRDSHGRFGEGSGDSVDKKTSVISEQGWIKSDGTFDPLQSGERPGTFGSQQFVEHHTEAAERLGLVKEKNMASQYVYDKAFATGAIRVAMANGVTLLESGKDFESSSAKEKMLNALDRISTDKVSIDFGRGANRPSFEGSVKDAKQWVKTGKEPSRLSKFRSLCYRPSIEHRWAEIDPLDIKETVLEGTDESPVTILLLRHGQTKSDANNEFCGWTDEDMDAEGLASVEEAAEEVLSRLTFTRVFSDDLQRTYHTAEVGLKYATGATEVIVNQGARTWDVGDLAGQKKTPETLAEKQYYVDHPKKVPPGSEECLKESKQRWMQFLLYVAAITPPGETSLVACHSSNFKTTSQAIDQKIKVWPSGIVRLTITAQGITAEVLRKGAVEQAYADDRERMKVLAREIRHIPTK